MTTITLQYDGRNSIFSYLVGAFLQAGAKLIEKKEVHPQNEVLEGYQKLFGKRRNNKYTDNEVFVYNSQQFLAPILEKYAD